MRADEFFNRANLFHATTYFKPGYVEMTREREIKLRKNQLGVTHVEVNCNAKQTAGIRPRGAEYIMHALSAPCEVEKSVAGRFLVTAETR